MEDSELLILISNEHKKIIESLPELIERAKKEFPGNNDLAISIVAVNASLSAFANILQRYNEKK